MKIDLIIPNNIPEDEADELFNRILDTFATSREAYAADVLDLAAGSRGFCKELFQLAMDVFALTEIDAHNKGSNVFNSSRKYDECVEHACNIALVASAFSDKEISDTMSDSEYREAKTVDSTLNSILKSVPNGPTMSFDFDVPEVSPRGRRGRERDRGSDRNDRGRDRDRNADRDRSSRGRNTGPAVSGVRARANTSRNNRDRQEERAVERNRRTTHVRNPAATAEPRTLRSRVSESILIPEVVDINTDGLHVVVGDKEEYVKGVKLENYARHELRALVSERSEGLLLPRYDFRTSPEFILENDEKEAAKFTRGTPIVSGGLGWYNVTKDQVVLGKTAYTITEVCHRRQLPKKFIDIIGYNGIVERSRTFGGWNSMLNAIRDYLEEAMEAGQDDALELEELSVALVSVERDLRYLFNQLLVQVLPVRARIHNFCTDYDDAMKFLRRNDNADFARMFNEVEGPYLQQNYGISLDQDPTKIITSNYIRLDIRGSLISDKLSFEAPGEAHLVSAAKQNELYTLFSKILRYRNHKHPNKTVMIADSYGGQYVLISFSLDGSPIYLAKPINNLEVLTS